MKKITLLLATVAFASVLASCANQNGPDQMATSASTTSTTAQTSGAPHHYKGEMN